MVNFVGQPPTIFRRTRGVGRVTYVPYTIFVTKRSTYGTVGVTVTFVIFRPLFHGGLRGHKRRVLYYSSSRFKRLQGHIRVGNFFYRRFTIVGKRNMGRTRFVLFTTLFPYGVGLFDVSLFGLHRHLRTYVFRCFFPGTFCKT